MASRATQWDHQGIHFWWIEKGPGAGQGLPFVFQHGLGGDRRGPLELYAYDPRVRLIALDCRAHGKTQPVGDVNKLRFDTFADDIIALLNYLQIEHFVAGGISMGAGVALNLALRYPERVLGLLLVRPAWLAAPAPPNLDGIVAAGQLIRDFGVEEGRQRFLASPLYEQIAHVSPYTASSLLAQFDEPRAADAWPRLLQLPGDAPNRDPAAWRMIQAPTLILGTDADPIHPCVYAETLADAIPGAHLVKTPSKALDQRAYTEAARAEIARFLAYSSSNARL